MLSRENDRVDADDFAVVIRESALAFRIRAQPRQGAVFTHFCLTLNQTVCVGDRRWHQHVGFVGRITEHQTLVACTLLQRIGTVNALVNIRRLFTNCTQYRARVGIKTHIRMDITNFTNGVTGDLFDIYPCAGSDFTTDQHHAGFYIGFTGNTRFRILFEDRIKHGVGDLVSNFVRMPF